MTNAKTPEEPDGHGMADVIEGPVGSASIVDLGSIPDREATLPELGLEDAVPTDSESH